VTLNAGDTWDSCGVAYHDTAFDSVFLLDARRAWAWVSAPTSYWSAPTAGGSSRGPVRNGVMRTDDGGCHWRGVSSADQNLTDGGELFFLDEQHGWLAGGSAGGLYATADGAHSWHRLPVPSERLWIKGVHFRDLDTGWFIADDERLYETRDAGRTWRKLPLAEVLGHSAGLIASWDRWNIGKLYAMPVRGGCFSREQLKRQRRR
jgi:photosystem II stability/assembly factor-like uncharacterized protein